MGSAGREGERSAGQEAGRAVHPSWEFARYVAAYRGNLTRSEAARRSGLPEIPWEQVETARPSEPPGDLIPAVIVATMCVSVGADVATGLGLAGYRPEMFPHLIENPTVFAPPTRSTTTLTGPCIATPHVVAAAMAADLSDVHAHMASVYRQLSEANWHLANRIMENQPDERRDYWSGYAAAVRAVAEQPARRPRARPTSPVVAAGDPPLRGWGTPVRKETHDARS